MTSPPPIDRREALRRAALVLGGVLSAPLAAGVLAGCEARGVPAGSWRPRALTPDQAELVATIAEQILPETDTPGARAVGVHRFIDALLAESYSAEQRQPFLAALADLGRVFQTSTPDQQRALLERLDREAAPFFRTLKDLTLVGFYTSEVGATRELHHVPVPGRYDGCIPLAQVGRTWAV
jgi:gluconate 2-dehydrogenase gamma chain